MVGSIFYPEDPLELEARLHAFGLERGKGGQAGVIIAPHGAWSISGKIAAAAFSASGGRNRGEVSRVILLGPIHNNPRDGLYLSDSDSFQTPLGELPVDQALNAELASCSTAFEINDIPHLREHSIEVLLPLVKFSFPGASIVPILMGGSKPVFIKALAEALRLVLEPIPEDSLLVVSCNYAMNADPGRALQESGICRRLFMEKDADAFSAGVQNKKISPCGGALAAALLESGLVSNMKPADLFSPLVTAKTEGDLTVYFGAFAYE
jgi:AmmeMemoRadiSam system protein B